MRTLTLESRKAVNGCKTPVTALQKKVPHQADVGSALEDVDMSGSIPCPRTLDYPSATNEDIVPHNETRATISPDI